MLLLLLTRKELENCRKELLDSEKQVLSRCHLRVMLTRVETVTGLRTVNYIGSTDKPRQGTEAM